MDVVAAHCAACGVRKALGLFNARGEMSEEFRDVLSGAGIECEVLLTKAPKQDPNPEAVEAAGRRRSSSGTAWGPALLFMRRGIGVSTRTTRAP
jgi:hypothetical protein